MLRVGLTGGLGSGKSTVMAYLKELGAAVLDADAIVRDLYRPEGKGAEAARELFGEDVVDREGNVDRSRIAALVFADPAKRHRLESRVHPLVREEIERRFAEAERSGARVAVSEASQLLEARSASHYDRVLLVVAPEEERLRRWEAKGGDAQDARRRMAAQIPPEEAAGRADYVLVNDGTLADLKKKVQALYRRWTESAGE